MRQITLEFPSPYVYILGDFNANLSRASNFGDDLISFCERYCFHISDYDVLASDTYTHVSMAHGNTSWLDHCISTSTGHDSISDIQVLHDCMSSDPFPLSVVIVLPNAINLPRENSHGTRGKHTSHKWHEASTANLQ